MKQVTYRCDICQGEVGPPHLDELIGILWQPGNRWVVVEVPATEQHICIECLHQLAQIWEQHNQGAEPDAEVEHGRWVIDGMVYTQRLKLPCAG